MSSQNAGLHVRVLIKTTRRGRAASGPSAVRLGLETGFGLSTSASDVWEGEDVAAEGDDAEVAVAEPFRAVAECHNAGEVQAAGERAGSSRRGPRTRLGRRRWRSPAPRRRALRPRSCRGWCWFVTGMLSSITIQPGTRAALVDADSRATVAIDRTESSRPHRLLSIFDCVLSASLRHYSLPPESAIQVGRMSGR